MRWTPPSYRRHNAAQAFALVAFTGFGRDTAGFPDTSDLLVRLGLSVSDGNVRIRRNGELRQIRAAITQSAPSITGQNRMAAR